MNSRAMTFGLITQRVTYVAADNKMNVMALRMERKGKESRSNITLHVYRQNL